MSGPGEETPVGLAGEPAGLSGDEAELEPPGSLAREGLTPEDEQLQLRDGFELAWSRCPDLRRLGTFVFADRVATFRVVGGQLGDDVFRAFSHLRVDDPAQAPALSVELWDEEETGVGVEGLAAGADLNAQGETFVSPDGRIVITARTQTRTAFDRKARHIVGWVGRSTSLTQYEIGRPLHSELLLWHRDRGVQAIHSGFVTRNGDGVLFGGPGGAGKSTTALTCLQAGFHYLADDYVALEALAHGGYVGHSLYCSTHIEPEHLKRFPALVPHSIPGHLPREDKHLVMLSQVLPGGLARKARIRAVALPRVTGAAKPSIRPATKVESLLRLAPSSLILLPYAGLAAREFEKLSDFLESVPTYWLELGEDIHGIPELIGQILEARS